MNDYDTFLYEYLKVSLFLERVVTGVSEGERQRWGDEGYGHRLAEIALFILS